MQQHEQHWHCIWRDRVIWLIDDRKRRRVRQYLTDYLRTQNLYGVHRKSAFNEPWSVPFHLWVFPSAVIKAVITRTSSPRTEKRRCRRELRLGVATFPRAQREPAAWR